MTEITSLCLIGCGDVFDSIATDLDAYGVLITDTRCIDVGDTSKIALVADNLLSELSPDRHQLFIAVDSQALNHARLELYGRGRFRGFRFATLTHRSAIISSSASIADNVWIGPGVILSHAVNVGSNTLIGSGARIDNHVSIGAHSWIGAGSAIGSRSDIATHCVLGADIVLRAGTRIGRNSLIDQPGPWQGEIASGTFAENTYGTPARMIGAGFSHHKKSAS